MLFRSCTLDGTNQEIADFALSSLRQLIHVGRSDMPDCKALQRPRNPDAPY